MAITRAQQYRQMLREGNVAMQGGVKNYLGKQKTVSDVPVKWKSGLNKPATELAYITDAEKKLLLKEDIHGSLKDGPNTGPEGIMSLDSQGDKTEDRSRGKGPGSGPGPQGDFRTNAQHTGLKGDYSKDRTVTGDVSAFKDTGTGKYELSTDPKDRLAVINYAQGKLGFQKGQKPGFFTGPGSFKQKQQIYNVQQRLNAIERYNNARKNKIVSGLQELNLNPAYDDADETFADLIEGAPSISTMTDRYSPETISDVLAGKRQIDFFSPIDPNLAPGLATKGLVGLANIVGPVMSGPVTQEKLNSLLGEINTLENINPADTTTKELMKEFAPNQYNTVYGPPKRGDGENQPAVIPRQTITADADDLNDDDDDYYGEGGNPFENRQAYRLFNKGGIADTVVGGEFDFESARQAYGLGKLVKKVTRAVKKVAKSPIGKAALLYAGGAGLSYLGAGAGAQSAGLGGFLRPGNFASNIGMSLGRIGLGSKFIGPKQPKSLMDMLGGKVGVGILGASALAGLMTPKEEEDDEEEYYRGEGLDIADIRSRPSFYQGQAYRLMSSGGSPEDAKEEPDLSNDPNYKGWVKVYETNPDAASMNENHSKYLQFYNKKAEGGSMKEPVAKKVMPLLDMDGQEMDLRAEGGFVPIGRMEKADDVPARLSKNEFVFTADAVRNAGEGDVDKGAEVMYNMMKNLESGGEVSEESQGLDGARKMFQTSQRLEEVL